MILLATRRPKAPRAHLSERPPAPAEHDDELRLQGQAQLPGQGGAESDAENGQEQAAEQATRPGKVSQSAGAAQAGKAAGTGATSQGGTVPQPGKAPQAGTGSQQISGAGGQKNATAANTDSANSATGGKRRTFAASLGAHQSRSEKSSLLEEDNSSAPVPARAFSGRLLVLAVVLVAITVLLAPTVKIWWEQRQELSSLRADIAQQEAQKSELSKEVHRWQDKSYVQQQARDRINMVMPGETGYWVFGGESYGPHQDSTPSGATTVDPASPWTTLFMESMQKAAK